jgi:2-oxoglutarate dehydrogenase E2 component (dihydrolipoamide succinyltransferase)
MSVEVVMPQMGESITEGTVSKWLKAVGDKIEKDEPILEISTDKVDAEVPSPAAGTLLEIRHQEGETVEVGTALAIIGAEGETAVQVGSGQKAESSAHAETPAPEILRTEPEEAKAASAATASESANPQSQIPNPKSDAATPIVMPQMGESITEGTVSKWLKAVGDTIEKDEPLLEISTDKVDAEVPSPAAGKLLEIKVNEGETVEVGAVLALVGAEGASQVSTPQSQVPSPPSASENGKAEPVKTETAVAAAASANPRSEIRNPQSNGDVSVEDLRRTKSSPLVRNIAKEHGIDITRIDGSGISGRVTKQDIMSFIETGAALRPQDLLRKDAPAAPSISAPAAKSEYKPAPGNHLGRRPRRENVGHAQEDRGAHDIIEADLGSRDERVRDRHDERRQVPRQEQGRVSIAIRHEADIHAVHLPGRQQCDSQIPDRQCPGRWREYRLQGRHKSRDGSGARLGIDRSGDQEGGHAFAIGSRTRSE